MSPVNRSAPESEGYRPLHPLPRGLVELYGFVAVLVVLIPEWMASGALQGLLRQAAGRGLPAQTRAWRRVPELRLASMSLAELRLLGRQFGLRDYATLSRDRLSARLLDLIRRQARRDGQRQMGLGVPLVLLLVLVLVVAGAMLLL